MADDDELFIITQTVEDNPRNIVDPTLQLPDHILHYIFSYLSFHELLHVRLVSKNWYLNTPSHFNFHFNESLFRKEDPTSNYSHNDFCDSIRSSINASKNKLINADKRVLHAQFINGEYIHDIMKLLEQNNFHEVYFSINEYYYCLPCIFQSKCLNVLHLTNCFLSKHMLCDEVTIPSLQELKLECVTLSEEILSKFISKFPNSRELSLVTCRGIISFIVLTNLACLEKLYVNVSDSSSFTNIQVIAPRLQVFHFISRGHNADANMDIRACKMMREFHLNCSKFPNGLDPENFCLDFPHLETLLLGPCQTEKPIKISSSSLRKWMLSFPQLYECSRKGFVLPSYRFSFITAQEL